MTDPDGVSVLAMMASSIVASKKAAASKLTPTPAEALIVKKQGVPEIPEVFLTNEAIHDIAVDLRLQAITLLNVAEGLDKMTGLSSEEAGERKKPVRPEEVKRAKEREADARFSKVLAEVADNAVERVLEAAKDEDFDARMKRQAKEAQAATFKPQAVAIGDGWYCPKHGKFEDKTTRFGRPFRKCPVDGCKEFERID